MSGGEGEEGTYGSALAWMFMGVFLNVEMALASSPTSLVESSRSRATPAASFPVSFWTFCTAHQHVNVD